MLWDRGEADGYARTSPRSVSQDADPPGPHPRGLRRPPGRQTSQTEVEAARSAPGCTTRARGRRSTARHQLWGMGVLTLQSDLINLQLPSIHSHTRFAATLTTQLFSRNAIHKSLPSHVTVHDNPASTYQSRCHGSITPRRSTAPPNRIFARRCHNYLITQPVTRNMHDHH